MFGWLTRPRGFGRWRACLLPLRIRPDGSTAGIPRDRLHVRSGTGRLIHSEIRLVQIRPPSSARPAHTPVETKPGPPPVPAYPDPVASKPVTKLRGRREPHRGDPPT